MAVLDFCLRAARYVVWCWVLAYGFHWGIAQESATGFHLSPRGDDRWSGRLPAANADGTDGPFLSLGRARDAVRTWRSEGGKGAATVQLHGGHYYQDAPVWFGPEDSGSADGMVSYEAAVGESPEIIGGRRIPVPVPIDSNRLIRFTLPGKNNGDWSFRSLFINGRREVRARYPNLDPLDPFRKGFLYVAPSRRDVRGGVNVGCIHNAGDWLEYRVRVPVSGNYWLWMRYGANNAPSGIRAMNGRCGVQVDGGATIPLRDLGDTGSWKVTRWGRVAKVSLSAGDHLLRWVNLSGGGVVMDLMALSGDPAWQPRGGQLALGDSHLIPWEARAFVRSQARHVQVGGAAEGPKDAIGCRADDVHPAWLAAQKAEVHIFQSGESRAYKEILAIRGYDALEGCLLLKGREATASLNPGDRFYVENVREELDAPGEWFLDEKSSQLAYLPRPDFGPGSEVIVPTTGHLISVVGGGDGVGVHHLRFAGITFRDTDWITSPASAGYGMGEDGAISFRNASDCIVEDCRFLNLGNYAVRLAGGQRNLIRQCDGSHLGGGGVLILNSSNNQVTDNHFHHLGEAYVHVGGVVLVGKDAARNLVAHNAIHDVPRYGISLKEPGSGNLVEYNRIQNTNLSTADTGAIEVTQHDRAFRAHSVIRGNLVLDTIGYSTSETGAIFNAWGIYLDSFASGYEVTGNWVDQTWNGGLMLQGGRDNRAVGNVFLGGRVAQTWLANHADSFSGIEVTSNFFGAMRKGAGWVVAGHLGRGIYMDRNTYAAPPGGPRFGLGGALGMAEWRRSGQDRNSEVIESKGSYGWVAGAYHGASSAGPPSVGPCRLKCSCVIEPASSVFWVGEMISSPAVGKR